MEPWARFCDDGMTEDARRLLSYGLQIGHALERYKGQDLAAFIGYVIREANADPGVILADLREQFGERPKK